MSILVPVKVRQIFAPQIVGCFRRKTVKPVLSQIHWGFAILHYVCCGTRTYIHLICNLLVKEACLQENKCFTDSIYTNEYLPKGEEPPTREQTRKKLVLTLRARTANMKNTERELIESQIAFLLSYFGRLTELVQKYTHPVGFDVVKEDAQRCVMYTYLVIGDILKVLQT